MSNKSSKDLHWIFILKPQCSQNLVFEQVSLVVFTLPCQTGDTLRDKMTEHQQIIRKPRYQCTPVSDYKRHCASNNLHRKWGKSIDGPHYVHERHWLRKQQSGNPCTGQDLCSLSWKNNQGQRFRVLFSNCWCFWFWGRWQE